MRNFAIPGNNTYKFMDAQETMLVTGSVAFYNPAIAASVLDPQSVLFKGFNRFDADRAHPAQACTRTFSIFKDFLRSVE
jgi:hypothetical protein